MLLLLLCSLYIGIFGLYGYSWHCFSTLSFLHASQMDEKLSSRNMYEYHANTKNMWIAIRDSISTVSAEEVGPRVRSRVTNMMKRASRQHLLESVI